MARIITKELALKIVEKLKANKIKTRSKAHDIYEVVYQGRWIAYISIRRGSEKDKGHDYIPKDLHISSSQAKQLGQCPWKYEQFIQEMIDKGFIQRD